MFSEVLHIFENVIKGFEVKVDVQNGSLRFKEKFDIICVSFIQFTFSFIICCQMIISLNDCHVHSCEGLHLGVLGFTNWGLIGALVGLLEFCSPDCG